MKTRCFIFFLSTTLIASCQSNQTSSEKLNGSVDVTLNQQRAELDSSHFKYNWLPQYDYRSSLINNIFTPKGYQRIAYDRDSFASWLRHLPLKQDNTVYLYNGEKKYNQTAQYKVLDIDIGSRDLQQCADAVMRLRAEYLYASNKFDKIHFNYTNGTNIPFSKWSSGYFPRLRGNKVVWIKSSNSQSYKSFKKYLNNIFMYAGTSSLSKEMQTISLDNIQPGDVLIKGGFPGHAVMVVDVAFNKRTGDKVFMIAQSYMPAQSMHVLKNFNNSKLSPWYSVNDIIDAIETPEWSFNSNQLKRFK